MHRSARSPLALNPRAAATSLAAALALVLAAACGHAPEEAAPVEEVAAPAAAPRKAAVANPAAAAAPAQEGAACDTPPDGECACDPGAAEESPEARIGATVESIEIGNAPTRGPSDAPVTLVVFSDFECPFCSKFAGVLDQLEQEYPGKLRLAFKHRPLPSHKQARVAARASMAAHAQGRFWEYHAALFDKAQGGLDQAGLDGRAAELGLDVARLGRDMRSPEVEARIAADEQEAERLKIAGTPTLFVNGRRVIGAQPIQVLRTAIDRALAGR